ncbi:hypothetical protein B0H13DRAFT_1887170 [Mycena leptocephala]|nr:hypothetical protein B0H13DRAFT_1887170 [Mycena leptocephala]
MYASKTKRVKGSATGIAGKMRPEVTLSVKSSSPHKLKITRKLWGNTAVLTRNLWAVHFRKPGTARDTVGHCGLVPTFAAGLSALSCMFGTIVSHQIPPKRQK